MAQSNDRRAKIKVFAALCWRCCDIMDGWRPVPAWVVAKSAGVSLYQARKQLRILKQEGRVANTSAVMDPEEPLPYHGYTVTPKGRQTGIYRYQQTKEARICAEVFGGTVESWLP